MFSLAFVVMSSIQSSTVAFAAADVHEADHVALRALRDKAATAINKQDIKALASCFAKDFVFTAVNQTVLTNEGPDAGFLRPHVQVKRCVGHQPEVRADGGYPDSFCGCQHGSVLRQFQRHVHHEVRRSG